MNVVWLTLLGFLSGSIPYAVWLGRLALKTDIRRFGDGNPGAANAWRAGRWWIGFPALLLDGLKGAVPVGYAHFERGIDGWSLVPIALAPVAGHAFSPWLRFRGGKAIAVTFGVWAGVAGPEIPIVLGLLFVLFYTTLDPEAWAVMTGIAFLGVYLLLSGVGGALLALWGGNLLLLLWKHREELRQRPGLKARLFRQKRGGA